MDDMMSKIQEILNDEESLNQIKKIAGMLSENSDDMPDLSSIFGGNSENPDQGEKKDGFNFDINKIMKIQQLMSQASQKDQNTEFLFALRPLVKDENQQKIDKIVKIFKLLALWPLLKDSGLLGGDIFDFL